MIAWNIVYILYLLCNIAILLFDSLSTLIFLPLPEKVTIYRKFAPKLVLFASGVLKNLSAACIIASGIV